MKDFYKIAEKFMIEGEIVDVSTQFGGHINDSYSITTTKDKYVLQRINHSIFKNPKQLMENFRKVCDYLKKEVKKRNGDEMREVLTLVKTKDNQDYYFDGENYWRMLVHIKNSICYETVKSAEDLVKTGETFGKFQTMLTDFPAHELYEVIPDFHHTKKRFQTFLEAVKNNKSNRAHLVADEIKFIMDRENETSLLVDMLEKQELPLRVTHNDTKLSNILLDANTKEGLCVIDFDTIMPGTVLYDFGDAIRTGACWSAEDEKDLSKVYIDLELYEAFTRAFVENAKAGLTETEIKYLPLGAKIITLEQGIRFLTDYLDGDLYYKTSYPEHNLDRTRTQLKLVADTESKWDAILSFVE